MTFPGETGDPYLDRTFGALLLAVEAKRAGIDNITASAMIELAELPDRAGREANATLASLHLDDHIRSAVIRILGDFQEVNVRLIAVQLGVAARILDRLSQETGESPAALLRDL